MLNHDGWMKISDFRGLDKMFFYYLLKNSRQHLLKQVAGGVFDNLKIDILKNFIIPLPPLEKQGKIANILDSLDRAIEENVRTKNTLEQVIQTIFKSWFVDFDPVKAKSEGKSPYGLDEVHAGLFSNAFTDSKLDRIPIGWSINKVWDIANFVNGAAYKNIHFCKPTGGLPPFIAMRFEKWVYKTNKIYRLKFRSKIFYLNRRHTFLMVRLTRYFD